MSVSPRAPKPRATPLADGNKCDEITSATKSGNRCNVMSHVFTLTSIVKTLVMPTNMIGKENEQINDVTFTYRILKKKLEIIKPSSSSELFVSKSRMKMQVYSETAYRNRLFIILSHCNTTCFTNQVALIVR